MSQPRQAPDLPLADDLFMTALDDRNGELLTNPHATGLGLAGALLGELLLRRNISIGSGHIAVVTEAVGIPHDTLVRRTLGRLMIEPETSDLPSWLAYFAQDAVTLVGERLDAAGWIRREEHPRRRGGTAVVHRPVDANSVAWRGIRLARILNDRGREPWSWRDILLAGLVNAAGLIKDVLWRGLRPGADHLQEALQAADQQWPDLCELVRHVEAAVGGTVLSHRS